MSLSTWAFALPRLWYTRKHCVLSACALVFAFTTAVAQCPDAPALPFAEPLERASDYRKVDAAVARAIDWTLSQFDEACSAEREQINAYLLVWLSGHPDIVVKLEPSAFPFFDRYPDLLYTALFAMARYEMETTASKRSSSAAHVAALEAIGEQIKATKTMRKDRSLRDFRRAWRRNRLEPWYTDRVR